MTIKLPRTLHIEGSRLPAGQVDPEAVPFEKLAGQFLVIEEKVDGSGVSIFFDDQLVPQIYHRGSPATGKEFRELHSFVKVFETDLYSLLEDRYVLFGEWMLHKHSIFYDRLPHYLLESDMFDKRSGIFLSTAARNAMLTGHTAYIKSVPVIASFKPTKLSQLTQLIGKPKYQSDNWREILWNKCDMYDWDLEKILKETDQSELMEGLYIKHEDERQILGRYKYVRYEFVNTIINSGSHVRERDPIHNVVLGS
jgi:hypothetical protein